MDSKISEHEVELFSKPDFFGIFSGVARILEDRGQIKKLEPSFIDFEPLKIGFTPLYIRFCAF